MSTIKVDAITDELGTGSPDFPNGITVNGSALTGLATAAQGALADSAVQPTDSLASANLTGALPAIDGSSLTGISSAPTTAQVLTATAGLTAGAVGTYMFGRAPNSVGAQPSFNFGSTYAGSGLHPAGLAGSSVVLSGSAYYYSTNTGIGLSTAPASSGTWRCVGQTPPPSLDEMPATLFVRIS
tara:strand:- start:83 stop:634 length:552 start_codon:yes stop_codon:yes gene_type:complete